MNPPARRGARASNTDTQPPADARGALAYFNRHFDLDRPWDGARMGAPCFNACFQLWSAPLRGLRFDEARARAASWTQALKIEPPASIARPKARDCVYWALTLLAKAAASGRQGPVEALCLAWAAPLCQRALSLPIPNALGGLNPLGEALGLSGSVSGALFSALEWTQHKLPTTLAAERSAKLCSLALGVAGLGFSKTSPEGAFIHEFALGLAAEGFVANRLTGQSALCALTLALGESPLGSTLSEMARRAGARKPLALALFDAFDEPADLGSALAQARAQGGLAPQGAPWSGAHPLRVLAQPRYPTGAWSAPMSALIEAGYGPDWSLPEGFEGKARAGAGDEPNFLLQWVKSNSHCLEEATRLAIQGGVDLQQRNARGETALGALNRRARLAGSPSDAQAALALACVHAGDRGLDLGARKNALDLAATAAIRALVLSESERRELEEGLDGALWASCLTQARAEMAQAAQERAPSARGARL